MTIRFAYLALVFLLLLPSAALGSRIDVSPTRLDLGEQRSGTIMLRNDGAEAVRFELFLYAWAQDENGEMQLEPSDALAFFPSVLELQPGASRPVRVGVLKAPTGLEASFRLLVKQLPSKKREDVGAAIEVLTDFSIPVFVALPRARARPQVQIDRLGGDRLELRLVNAGSRSFRPTRLLVHALDEAGAVIHEAEIPGWYVLALSERRYELPLPRGVCKRTRRVVVRAEVAGEKPLEVERAIACRP